MSEIRTLTSEDIPAVASMFQKTFRQSDVAAPESLRAYLRSVFLEHPWQDPAIASRVHVTDAGQVNGFLGVLPLRMTLEGQAVRGALASSLMVEDAATDPLAGAKLVRSFLNGPQDISLAETANEVAQRMWEKVGSVALPAFSMDWLRVFRPGMLALGVAAGRFRPLAVLRPFARAFDAVARRFSGNPFRWNGAATDLVGRDVSDDELAALLPELAERYALHPAWEPASLAWFLEHASVKERHGDLRRRVVFDRRNQPVGCYLYYGRPNAIAWVLQVLAAPASAGRVLDDLFAHAWQHGATAVRGRALPQMMNALLGRNCVFFHRSSAMVHSRRKDLLAAVNSGEALMIGLAGESWARIIGGTFL